VAGALIVVSHDRYLLERVTDQQYAILDGRLRHLPGGIDEYLRLAGSSETSVPAPAQQSPSPTVSGADLRAIEKEIASLDRALGRLAEKITAKHHELAAHDQSDHVGLGQLAQQLRALEDEVATKEGRWLELSERLE